MLFTVCFDVLKQICGLRGFFYERKYRAHGQLNVVDVFSGFHIFVFLIARNVSTGPGFRPTAYRSQRWPADAGSEAGNPMSASKTQPNSNRIQHPKREGCLDEAAGTAMLIMPRGKARGVREMRKRPPREKRWRAQLPWCKPLRGYGVTHCGACAASFTTSEAVLGMRCVSLNRLSNTHNNRQSSRSAISFSFTITSFARMRSRR